MTTNQIIYRDLRKDGLDPEEARRVLINEYLNGEVRAYAELDFSEDITVPYQEAG